MCIQGRFFTIMPKKQGKGSQALPALYGGEFMRKFKRGKKPNMDAINLLVSILVCYPEIGTVSFEPDDNTLKLTYVLGKVPEKSLQESAAAFIEDSIVTYHSLEGFSDGHIAIVFDVQDGAAFLHIIRDMNTISQGEIGLVSTLVREQFAAVLISDLNRDAAEEADVVREEVIDRMLGSMKVNRVGERMIGIREEGRVMVFNK